MKQNMGEIIRKLRKDCGVTQEELAEQIGVTAQAVSKWENNNRLPDICQIVPLANFFGVSTDVLFGTGDNHAEEVEKSLSDIFRLCDNCHAGEEGRTTVLVLDKYRDLIRLYPGNPTVLNNALSFLNMVLDNNENDLRAVIGQGGIDSLTTEGELWAARLIKYSSNPNYILNAKSILSDIEVRRKNWPNASALMEDFPEDLHFIKSIRLADISYKSGDSNKERKYRCENVKMLLWQLSHQVYTLGNLYMRQEKYTDANRCYSFMRGLLDLLYQNESYRAPFVNDSYPLFRFPAYCQMKLGNEDEAITLLEKGVEYLKMQAKYYNKKTKFDTPLLRDCTFSYGFGGTAEYGNLKILISGLICGDEFEPLRANPRYQELLESANLA